MGVQQLHLFLRRHARVRVFSGVMGSKYSRVRRLPAFFMTEVCQTACHWDAYCCETLADDKSARQSRYGARTSGLGA